METGKLSEAVALGSKDDGLDSGGMGLRGGWERAQAPAWGRLVSTVVWSLR